jgi:predicted dehydrogenase
VRYPVAQATSHAVVWSSRTDGFPALWGVGTMSYRSRRNGDGAGRITDEIRVGVVGLGYWGPNLLRVLSGITHCHISAICDLDPDQLEVFGRRHPEARATTEYRDLLEDPEIDAILLATPVRTHFELASRTIEAGKHVFVEKPLTGSTREADELIASARDNDVALMCGHTFLYSSPVRAVKGLLDRGELGDVCFISSSRVNLGPYRPDVSVVCDLGPHDFSILRYWLDEVPDSVTAAGHDAISDGIADVAFITMKFPSNILVNVEMSWLAPSKLRRTVIVGTEKMVVYEDGTPEPLRIYDRGIVYRDPASFGEYHLSYRTGDILTPHLDNMEPLVLQLKDFLVAVRTGSVPPGHHDLCRDVVMMVEASEASLQGGGKPVSLEADGTRTLVA